MTSSLRLLEWDSAFFGFPIAHAVAATAEDVTAIDEWAARQTVRCVYLLVSMNTLDAIQAAQRLGFFLAAVRVTCQTNAPFNLVVPKQCAATVRKGASADLAALRAIASKAHQQTRFYNDPQFSRHDCDRLYVAWIERSCSGWADQVLVADIGGEIEGYITLHRSESDSGTIGLLAVAESARGRGVGSGLIDAGMRWFESAGVHTVSVATQGHNVTALRAYQKAGFTVSAADVWMHKWR